MTFLFVFLGTNSVMVYTVQKQTVATVVEKYSSGNILIRATCRKYSVKRALTVQAIGALIGMKPPCV